MVGTVRVRGILSLSSRGKADEASEDAIAVARRGTRAALCDGASASYDAAGWARALARAVLAPAPYHGSAERRAGALMAAFDEARRLHQTASETHAAPESSSPSNFTDPPADQPWYAREARASGDFATLLYVQARHGTIEFASIGDSILLAAGEQGIFCWPDPLEYDFGASPELIHSREPQPELLDVAAAWRSVRLRDLGRRPVVILASDAVAPMVTAAARSHDLLDAALELAELAALGRDSAVGVANARRSAGTFRDDDLTVGVMR